MGEELAKGVLSAQGKDLWEKVKAVVTSFEKKPQDVKQQGKLELLLEQKFEQLSEKDMLELYLKAKSKKTNWEYSLNCVRDKTLNTAPIFFRTNTDITSLPVS